MRLIEIAQNTYAVIVRDPMNGKEFLFTVCNLTMELAQLLTIEKTA